MTIKGKIKFNGVKRVIPSPSCLYVNVADVSRMDAPSTPIGSRRFNVSGYDTRKDFDYEMTIKKPAESQLGMRYSISATIHVGRCPETKQGVNRGDFLTDTRHPLHLAKETNVYENDVKIICYGTACVNNDKKKTA